MLLEPFIVNDRTPFQRWCDGSGPRTTPDYVYVASSRWNHLQQAVVGALRFLKIPHYDFRNPEAGNHGFWQNIDPEWKQWTPQQWREGLRNPISQKAFHLDLTALRKADVGVLVLPCGISASLEAGYLAGRGVPVFTLASVPTQPELMMLLLGSAERLCTDLDELFDCLGVGRDLP